MWENDGNFNGLNGHSTTALDPQAYTTALLRHRLQQPKAKRIPRHDFR